MAALQHDEAGGDMGQVLGNLKNNGWVNDRRNEYGADFVTQVHRTGACGLGYVAEASLALTQVRDDIANFMPTRVGNNPPAYILRNRHSNQCLDMVAGRVITAPRLFSGLATPEITSGFIWSG